MGADIHLHIEYKVGDQPWKADERHQVTEEDGYTYVADFGSRDYHLFANLAGVRGDGPEPRGVPDDVSEIVDKSIKGWSGNGHSHSWNTLEDFAEILIQSDYDLSPDREDRYGSDYPKLIESAQAKVKKYKLDLEAEQMLLDQPINTEVKCRFVYFFDN